MERKQHQYLDLSNFDNYVAWMTAFIARYRYEKKEDQIKSDGTIEDLQVISLFLSTSGSEAKLNLEV